MTETIKIKSDIINPTPAIQTSNNTFSGTNTFSSTVTFSGSVTFSNSPNVPAPTNNTDAATKKYVDDLVGDVETLLASI